MRLSVISALFFVCYVTWAILNDSIYSLSIEINGACASLRSCRVFLAMHIEYLFWIARRKRLGRRAACRYELLDLSVHDTENYSVRCISAGFRLHSNLARNPSQRSDDRV